MFKMNLVFMIFGALKIQTPVASHGAKTTLLFFVDYIIGWFLDKLNDLVTQVDIQASIKTDHSSIILELENIKEGPRGPGFWKLHTSLLARSDYVEMINKELPNWLKDAEDLSDKRVKWDWLMFKIKTSSIAYSKKLSRASVSLMFEYMFLFIVTFPM